ncbi:hypothetical protein [Novosphingobium sp. Gsoil 351]|uniref:hypothetical protein n=1 Tax=Novosphingobium sp. Gsoil 351 TaxID=2675225 RepID=UPI0018A855DC|nr:hypothetical protein [Novosphingobium sp. Gsoil 351]
MSDAGRLQLKAKGQRPQYFDDPAIDKVLAITLALAGETAVLHDRVDTIERLLEQGVPVTRAAIDAYQPDAATREERDSWRDQFLDNVLRIIHQEREELALRAGEQAPYDDAVILVESTAP